jgi:drug/metabolite transporter (DMT)-like permease
LIRTLSSWGTSEMFLIAVMYLFFAATFPVGKIVLDYTDSIMFLTGIRMLIGGALILAYRKFTGSNKSEPKVERRDWIYIFKNGLFGFYIAFVLEFWALRYIQSIKINLFWSFSPFVAALMGYIFLREKLYLKKWMGLIVGFMGMLIMLLGKEGVAAGKTMFQISLPEVAMLGAVVSATYAWFFVQNLTRRGHSISLISGVSMVLSGVMCLATHYIINPNNLMPITGQGAFWTGVFVLIVISNFIAFPLYSYLLKFYTVTFMSLAGLLCPVFGTIIGWFLLGETITIAMAIGFIAVAAGMSLFYLEETA